MAEEKWTEPNNLIIEQIEIGPMQNFTYLRCLLYDLGTYSSRCLFRCVVLVLVYLDTKHPT